MCNLQSAKDCASVKRHWRQYMPEHKRWRSSICALGLIYVAAGRARTRLGKRPSAVELGPRCYSRLGQKTTCDSILACSTHPFVVLCSE
ncbi:hypothetical protein K439DRAFT_399879 [Ramaria rubella]|nr:hypothetical protein K439DRAFT_399879 [Ramaria rubella]